MFITLTICFVTINVAFASTKNVPLGRRSALILKESALTFDSMNQTEQKNCANNVFDVVFYELGMFMRRFRFDPLQLPDIYQGGLNLTHGLAYEVSNITRNGDVELSYLDRIVTNNVPLKFNKIRFTYDYAAKLLGFGPTGSGEGGAINVQAYYALTIDFRELRITLNDLRIVKIDTIDCCKFSGNLLTDILANLLSPLISNILKGLIISVIEDNARKSVTDFLETINNSLRDWELSLNSENATETGSTASSIAAKCL